MRIQESLSITAIAYSVYESAKNLLSNWIFRFKTHKDQVIDSSNIYVPSYDSLPVAKKTKEKKVKDDESVETRFRLRSQVLDRLDEHFHYIRMMKKADPASYALYKTSGGVVTNDYGFYHGHDKQADTFEVSSWFGEKLPSFGCVLFITEKHEEEDLDKEDGKDISLPRMVYFRKYEKPPLEIQPAHEEGAVYVCGIFWHSQKNYKFSVTTEFAVLVKPDNSVKLLNMKLDDTIHLKTKKKDWDGVRRPATLHRTKWGIPSFYSKIFKEVRHPLLFLFTCSAIQYEINSMQEMVEIKASKNGISAIFGVDIERTPYFFKDRIANFENGKKKRIFHIVRPHERITSKGSKIIKTHFRGDSQFMWNGYKINITVPEFQNSWRTVDFNIGAIDESDIQVDDAVLAEDALQIIEEKRMQRINDHLHG